MVTLDVQPDVLSSRPDQRHRTGGNQMTGLFSATVELDNPDGKLKPGMYGTAHVVVRERERCLGGAGAGGLHR
jgi:multidrug efflux pump subunit AcrA (membrane-fusion protein)